MSEERVRPARPHHKLTDDGRRMREVLTYSRRGSRFTPKQAQAWEAYAERWWLPDEAVDEPGFSLAGMFGRTAPLIVEIGSGIGESTVALAATRPDHDVVAFEVWRPGVADTLGRVGEAGLSNVRLLSVDAVWSMEHLVEPGEPGRAVDVLPRPLAQEEAPQAPAGHARVRARWPRAGSRPAPSGGWRPTGPTTPSRWSRCSTPSRC